MSMDADADWLAWIRTNPGTDTGKLLALLDAAQSDLFESKAEVDARDAEIRERDAEIVRLQEQIAAAERSITLYAADVARLNAALLAQDERDQNNFDEGRRFERRAALAAQADDEARRRRIILEACDRAFGPDGAARPRRR